MILKIMITSCTMLKKVDHLSLFFNHKHLGNAGVGLGLEFIIMHVLVISAIITLTY